MDHAHAYISLFIAALACVACGEDEDGEGEQPVVGTPIGGTVSGQYGDEPFQPGYGVALDVDANPLAKVDVQLGETAINCDRHLKGGVGNPLGIFVRIFVPEVAVGSYSEVFVEFIELSQAGTRQRGASNGELELTDVTPELISGTISHQADADDVGLVTLDGSFEVTRCTP